MCHHTRQPFAPAPHIAAHAQAFRATALRFFGYRKAPHAITVHANWIKLLTDKITCMRLSGMWLVDGTESCAAVARPLPRFEPVGFDPAVGSIRGWHKLARQPTAAVGGGGEAAWTQALAHRCACIAYHGML